MGRCSSMPLRRTRSTTAGRRCDARSCQLLQRDGILREVAQYPGDILSALTPRVLLDLDPRRVGWGQVANDVQRVGDLSDPKRIGRRQSAILEARVEQRRPSGAVGPELEAVGGEAKIGRAS